MTAGSVVFDSLDAALDEKGRAWLGTALARIEDRNEAILEVSPAAGRSCGRGPLAGAPGWTVDQAVRARLLLALRADGARLGELVFEVYRYGDAAERLAVLKALPFLPGLEDHALPVVRDALRTNDTRLIEAAVGPYGGQRLPDTEYRQAVLKCVFVGVPLNAVAGLADRTDHELARMLADYAHERLVAGRDVPADLWPVVRPYPDVLDGVTALKESKGDL